MRYVAVDDLYTDSHGNEALPSDDGTIFRRISHHNNIRPGTAAIVVTTKNTTQLVLSARKPAGEERKVRANAIKEDSKAYCVAV